MHNVLPLSPSNVDSSSRSRWVVVGILICEAHSTRSSGPAGTGPRAYCSSHQLRRTASLQVLVPSPMSSNKHSGCTCRPRRADVARLSREIPFQCSKRLHPSTACRVHLLCRREAADHVLAMRRADTLSEVINLMTATCSCWDRLGLPM